MTDARLEDVSTHFAFGKNWASYAKAIDPDRIEQAKTSLARLLKPTELEGARFLDIGCGSGLSSLAALRLGAREIIALDIDPDSVATAQQVLANHAPEGGWSADVATVFDLSPERQGRFDVVYSWGVLHHTGAMHEAIKKAAAMVGEHGIFAFALYRKTPMCGFWTLEKRWYSHAETRKQQVARRLYTYLLKSRLRLSGQDPTTYIHNYRSQRGMNFEHDVHDWLGGYPYESITPSEVRRTMGELGFTEVRSVTERAGIGLFGSGCDEFVFRRN